MKPYILPIATAMATSLLTLSLVTYASDSAPTGRPHRAGPPPEAPAACSGKGIGDAVTITLADGRSISGSCQLMFRPDNLPAR